MNATLTIEEWKLISDLIELWNKGFDNSRCSTRCECSICKAIEKAGEHDFRTFDSLAEKARTAMKAREA
jgi:hypothetical protein